MATTNGALSPPTNSHDDAGVDVNVADSPANKRKRHEQDLTTENNNVRSSWPRIQQVQRDILQVLERWVINLASRFR